MRFLCLFLSLSGFLLAIKLPAQNLNNGLVACYSFSGNANDGSGHGYNGTVNGAVLTADRFGNPNSAYQFDGVSSYVSIPSTAFANPNYSYSAWVYITTIPGNTDVGNIVSIGDNTGKHQTINLANFYASAGATGFGAGGYNVGTPTNQGTETGSLPAVPGWYHIVGTRNNTSISLYLNGQFISSTSTNNTTPYYGNPVSAIIGARCNLIQFFQGVIDDLTFYNRALTAQEVQLLHQLGLACPLVIPPPSVNNEVRCGTGTVVLTASAGTTYRWYDAAIGGTLLFEGNPFTSPNLSNSTYYYVSNVVNNIESDRSQVMITITPLSTCLFIPNVLTVNSDTLNSRLTAFVRRGNYYTPYSGSTPFQMKILNRWGAEIYQTTDITTGWRGENVDEGIYYYYITLGEQNFKGWVSVLK
jgi:hypothetical protein